MSLSFILGLFRWNPPKQGPNSLQNKGRSFGFQVYIYTYSTSPGLAGRSSESIVAEKIIALMLSEKNLAELRDYLDV